MQAIKTKALVREQGQLHFMGSPLGLDNGPATKTSWQNILAGIGTYTDEELSGLAEVRKEFDQWQPAEF